MTQLRIREVAAFLAVSDDTVRRLVEGGTLTATVDEAGRKTIDGYQVAQYAREHRQAFPDGSGVKRSARNRFVGLVTDIRSDAVMAQVELQCGPFRVVSLMSREAVDSLGLEVGSVATATARFDGVVSVAVAVISQSAKKLTPLSLSTGTLLPSSVIPTVVSALGT